MPKFNWVNDDVKIDFPISKGMENTMKEAEELDLARSVEYTHVADALDIMGKNAYAAGKITKEQWDRICKRYPYVEVIGE